MIRHYDWEGYYNTNTLSNTHQNHKSPMSGVIVAEDIDLGYIVINKPAGVPVHSTVDNELENVSSEISRMLLKRTVHQESHFHDTTMIQTKDQHPHPRQRQRQTSMQKANKLVYVTTPQRLDQNTSGLFVVSTKKSFASYFAKLLSQKTQEQLSQQNMNIEHKQMNASTDVDLNNSKVYTNGNIHKKYKCLVCILENEKGTYVSIVYDTDIGFIFCLFVSHHL